MGEIVHCIPRRRAMYWPPLMTKGKNDSFINFIVKDDRNPF
jgi:hypothetical protein